MTGMTTRAKNPNTAIIATAAVDEPMTRENTTSDSAAHGPATPMTHLRPTTSTSSTEVMTPRMPTAFMTVVEANAATSPMPWARRIDGIQDSAA